MSTHKPAVIIADMIEALEQMGRFIHSYDAISFVNDERTVQAVCRCLQILAEAAARTPEPLRLRFADMPWSRLTGLRRYLVHGYFDVDRDLLWRMAADDAPPLLAQLRTMLAHLQSDPSPSQP